MVSSHKLLTLSLIIPAYNEEDRIIGCLEAIAAQTVAPDEVIVIDNNSTDSTVKITQRYPFVTLVKESRQGIVFARDKGFSLAIGDIIGRIDADTILSQDWVEKVKLFYADPTHANQALTGGGYFYNIRLPRFNGWAQSQFAFRLNRFIVGHYILWGSNMAFPAALWRAVKADVCHDNQVHEDLDVAIHLHRLGHPIIYSAQLRVGVYLKRVWEDRSQQAEHLSRWPLTLKSHGFFLWWLSLLGNVLMKYIGQPYVFATEGIARIWERLNWRQKERDVAQYNET